MTVYDRGINGCIGGVYDFIGVHGNEEAEWVTAAPESFVQQLAENSHARQHARSLFECAL